jgi:hypothetical protein
MLQQVKILLLPMTLEVLDLVASEIIFGHKSEAFHRVSQAKPAAAIPVPADDDKLCRKGNAGYCLQGRCRQ